MCIFRYSRSTFFPTLMSSTSEEKGTRWNVSFFYCRSHTTHTSPEHPKDVAPFLTERDERGMKKKTMRRSPSTAAVVWLFCVFSVSLPFLLAPFPPVVIDTFSPWVNLFKNHLRRRLCTVCDIPRVAECKKNEFPHFRLSVESEKTKETKESWTSSTQQGLLPKHPKRLGLISCNEINRKEESHCRASLTPSHMCIVSLDKVKEIFSLIYPSPVCDLRRG